MKSSIKCLLYLIIFCAIIVLAIPGCGWMSPGYPCEFSSTLMDMQGYTQGRSGVDEESLKEGKVHPYSQSEMQLTILSDSLVQLKYQRDGKETVEIYRVTEKSRL